MPLSTATIPTLSVLVLLLCFAPPTLAFGSGQVSEASGVFGRNFLHGDVENVLTELVKTTAAGGAGILGAILSGGSRAGKKFTPDDVKRVYFGNWLRDLSQAIDVSTLKLLPAQRIVNVVALLGFLEFGFATREFEVTPERLGCYNTVEHLDNCTGYPDDRGGDPRQIANYPHLRGPLNPRELEIDERNGMKKYLATENQGFDTGSRFIRDNLVRCIELGRSGKHNEVDEWESLRLLGTALHTLEDFAAHSNFIEVALQSLGYGRVFAHVGDRVRIRAPNGREVAPIVTGSFGGADFMHSMLGNVEDKISQNSAQDVSAKFDDHRGKDGGALRAVLKLVLSKDEGPEQPSQTQQQPDQQVDRLEELRRRAGEMNPTDVSEEEVGQFLREVMTVHDDIARTVASIVDRIPGLEALLGEVSTNLGVFVFSTLEPVMAPLFRTVTGVLFEASAAVVDNHDQTIVFSDPEASDPTHSMLAKDHFGNLLNAPAGKLAQVIVRHTVQAVVEAWDDERIDPHRVAAQALTALHHPDFVGDQPSPVQQEMLGFVRTWIGSHGNEKDEVLRRLEREAVLQHRNTTQGLSGGGTIVEADANKDKYQAASQGLAGLVKPGGVLQDAPGADVVAGVLGALSLDEDEGRQGRQQYGQKQSGQQQHGQQQQGQQQNQYGQPQDDERRYSIGNRPQQHQQEQQEDRFGARNEGRYGGDNESYGGQRNDEDAGRYGRNDEGRNEHDDRYGRNDRTDEHQQRYGRNDRNEGSEDRYGRNDRNENENRYGHNDRKEENENRYGRTDENQQRYNRDDRFDGNENRYGRNDRSNENETRHGSGIQSRYTDNEEGTRYGGQSQNESHHYGGQRNDEDSRHGSQTHNYGSNDHDGETRYGNQHRFSTEPNLSASRFGGGGRNEGYDGDRGYDDDQQRVEQDERIGSSGRGREHEEDERPGMREQGGYRHGRGEEDGGGRSGFGGRGGY